MNDEISVHINADFSTFEQSFKEFSKSLSLYSDIPGMKTQVDGLTASFTKLMEITSSMDKSLENTSGIKSAQQALASFNAQANTSAETVKAIQNLWQPFSKSGLMTPDQLDKFIDPKVLDSKMKAMTASQRATKEKDMKDGFKTPLNMGYNSKNQRAELEDGYTRYGIAKEMGMKNIPIRVSNQPIKDNSGFPVTGSTSKGPNTHGDYDPSEVFGVELKNVSSEMKQMADITTSINKIFDGLFTDAKSIESTIKSENVKKTSVPRSPRTNTRTKLPESSRTTKESLSDEELNTMFSEIGIDPKTITGRKQRSNSKGEFAIPDKIEEDETTLEKEFGTEESGSNVKNISNMDKNVQALFKKMKGKGRIEGYNDKEWSDSLSRIKKEQPELTGSSLKSEVQKAVDVLMGTNKKTNDSKKKTAQQEASTNRTTDNVSTSTTKQEDALQRKKDELAKQEAERDRLAKIEQAKLDSKPIDDSSIPLTPAQKRKNTIAQKKAEKDALEKSIDNKNNGVTVEKVSPSVVKPEVIPESIIKPIVEAIVKPIEEVVKPTSTVTTPVVTPISKPESSNKTIEPVVAPVVAPIVQNESEALKRIQEASLIQEQKVADMKTKNAEVELQQQTKVNEAVTKNNETTKNSDTKSEQATKTRKPRSSNSNKGLVGKTPEQLEEELKLLTSENEMVANLIQGFKELVDVIIQKNALLREESTLVKEEASGLTVINQGINPVTTTTNPTPNQVIPTTGGNSNNRGGVRPRPIGPTSNNITEDLVTPTNQFFNAFGSQSGGLLSQLSKLQSSLMSIRFAFQGMIMMAGGKEIYNFLIGINAQIQTLETSLAVTMKSAQKAEDTVQQLRSYSATTPFQELDTFKSGEMLASNNMDVMSNIKSAGDLASAKATRGTTLEDVVNIQTRINSGDFGKAMIRLRQLGISLADFRTEGLKFSKNNTFEGTSSQMLTALNKIIESKYGGLTQALGQTVNGSISTIKDYFQQLGIDLGSGIFGQFQTSLNKWKKELHDFRNSEEFKQIIVNFNTTFNSLKDFVTPIGFVLGTVFKGVLKYMPEIASYIKIFASVKMLQGLLGGISILQANWAKVTEQQVLQTGAINATNEEEVIGNGILDNTLNTLSSILAMRRLGLKAATDTSAADAVASETMSVRGVGFGQKYYRKASSGSGLINSEEDIVAAGGVSEARLAQYNSQIGTGAVEGAVVRSSAETASLGAMEGSGAAAEAGASLGVLSGIAGTMLLILPAILLISNIVGSMNKSNESKFTSDDYKRMASEQITSKNNLDDLNTQRISAKSQIDDSAKSLKPNQDAVTSARQNLANNPNSKDAQDALASAQYNLASSTTQSEQAQQRLETATQQIVELDPELASTLIDQNGAITDSTSAFQANTKAIQDNIDRRIEEIANKKEQQISAAKTESVKAGKTIDNNNELLNYKGTSTSAYTRIVSGLDSTLLGGLNGILGIVGQKSDKITQLQKVFSFLTNDTSGRANTLSDNVIDNASQKDIQNSALALQRTKDDAIKNGYVNSKGTVLYDDYQKKLDANSKSAGDYLYQETGASTRAGEITEAGTTKIDQVKNQYTVKLNNIAKQHNGDKNTVDYKQMELERDNAIDSASKESTDELDSLYKLNESTKKGILQSQESTLLGPIAKLMESQPDLKYSDIQDALNLISNNNANMITGAMKPYKKKLEDFFNNDLKGNLKLLNPLSETTDKMEQMDNNKDTIKVSQDNLALKLSQETQDRKDNEYSDYSKQADNKLTEATANKEIALQQQSAIGNAKGTEMYDKSMKESDATLKDIINSNIVGFKKLLASGTLSEDNQWAAKSKIADLQKQANDLTSEINETLNKDKLTLLNEKYDGKISVAQGQKDLTLQNDKLNNYTEDSSKYIQDDTTASLGIRDQMLSKINELTAIIPTMHGLDQITAMTTQIDLQKQANQIMLDIKANTNKFGEFNAPGFVKTMTYYDYMTQDSKAKTMEIGTASFVFQIDSPQSLKDIENLKDLVTTAVGETTQSSARSGNAFIWSRG